MTFGIHFVSRHPCPLVQTIESETFDLAGQTVSTITTNIHNAFCEPLPLEEMIRITLVTGAGKLARQKYDPDAAKAVTAALQKLGFVEDRGASCVKECAGSFKLQHDTGKNLKTVVVFPNISAGSNDDGEADGGLTTSGSVVSLLPKGSPEEMIAVSSKSVFENMVKSKCPSWSQKKGCLAALASIKATLSGLEQKLLSGTPLNDAEQSFYDSVSSADLDEKQNHVKDKMHEQVEQGLITNREKAQLLAQVTERLDNLSKEIAEAEGKPKKLEKLMGMKEKADTRKEMLSKIAPKAPHRLKHEAEILKLRAELLPLLELEEGSKGRLLSLKETQSLARKDVILEEIADLEVSDSRNSLSNSLPACPHKVSVHRDSRRKKAEDGLKMTKHLA